jgi:protocatechuate 3,4-dioxygenase, alpha subunit
VSTFVTPSQTVGPFFHIGLEPMAISNLSSGIVGEPIEMTGRIVDGDGQPVIDAVIELWQANAAGKYSHPEDTQDKLPTEKFKGYGRVATDSNGKYRFITMKPGAVRGPNGNSQAPHIAVNLFMRGLLKHLVTRVYFPDEPSNENDAVLMRVPRERRSTLIANWVSGQRALLSWDIILQGGHETVFFDC